MPFTVLTAQVTTLIMQVTALTQTVQTLVDDVGELKGQGLEAVYRSRGHAYFSRMLRRPHVLTPDELTALIEDVHAQELDATLELASGGGQAGSLRDARATP